MQCIIHFQMYNTGLHITWLLILSVSILRNWSVSMTEEKLAIEPN